MLTPNIFIDFNESDPLIFSVIKIELKLPLQYSHINILIPAN